MSSGRYAKTKGGFGQASWYWLWTIVGMIAYELAMLVMGNKGGALSHVVWWANDVDTGLYSWRWALVSGPLAGFLLWCLPHFLWGVGGGLELFIFVVVTFTVLSVLVLIH